MAQRGKKRNNVEEEWMFMIATLIEGAMKGKGSGGCNGEKESISAMCTGNTMERTNRQ